MQDIKTGGVAGKMALFMQKQQEQSTSTPNSPGPSQQSPKPTLNNSQPQQPQPANNAPATASATNGNNNPQQPQGGRPSQHSRGGKLDGSGSLPTRALPKQPGASTAGSDSPNVNRQLPTPGPKPTNNNNPIPQNNLTSTAASPNKAPTGGSAPPPIPAFRKPVNGENPPPNGTSIDDTPTSPKGPGTPERGNRRSIGNVTQNINQQPRPNPTPGPKPAQNGPTNAPQNGLHSSGNPAGSQSPGPQHQRPGATQDTPSPGSPGPNSPGPSLLKRSGHKRPVSERPPVPKSALPTRPTSMVAGPPISPSSSTESLPPLQQPLPTPAPPTNGDASPEGAASNEEAPAEKKEKPPQDLAKMARLRIQVVNELVTTERLYIKDLELVIKVFLFPMQAMSILPEQAVSAIFSNIEIILNVNKEFFTSLENRLKEYPPDDASMPLGDLFRKMGDYFKMYTTYCANHPIAVNTVAKLEESDSQFSNYLRVCQSDKEVDGKRIYDFLIKPVQRLCKYPLLLRELLKNTEESHPDYPMLIEAQKKIDDVVDYINERKRNAEGNQQVFDIQIQTEGIHLVSPTRHLVKEGVLMSHDSKNLDSKSQKLVVFLFNDLLVLVKPKANKYFEKERRQKNCFQLKAKVPLGTAKLISMSMEGTKIDNCFQVQYIPENADGEVDLKTPSQSLTLSAESQQEVLQWTQQIKIRIKEFQRRKYLDQMRGGSPGGRDSMVSGSMITFSRSASSNAIPIPDARRLASPTVSRADSPPSSPHSSASVSAHGEASAPAQTATATPVDPAVSAAIASPPGSPLPAAGGWTFSPSVRRKVPLATAGGSRGSTRMQPPSIPLRNDTTNKAS